MQMIGYLRVSSEEQKQSGLGIEAQKRAIEAAVKGRHWRMRWIRDDGYSAKDLQRPGIQEALALLTAGKADGIITMKLDRLSRSLFDFAKLMQDSQKQGWEIVALDASVDTTTPQGKMVVGVLATFAEFERDLIRQRTKDALAMKRAQGVKLGRPRILSASVIRRIHRARRRGDSYAHIAQALNAASIPTAHGGVWRPGTVWVCIPGNVKERARRRADRSRRNGRAYQAINGKHPL